MSEEKKKRVEKSRDPNVWKKWLDECVVTSSEVEQNDDSENEEIQTSDHESSSQQMDNPVNEFDAQTDEEDSGSDEESGDSSDEDLGSGEEEEGESEDEEDVEEFYVDQNLDTISSDDAGNSGRERCPICLNRFVGQDLGTPESCEHTFCFECIQEWSMNINTCPIDRTEFNNIRVRATSDGNDIKRVKVKVRPKEAEDAPQDSVTLCEVCHHGDREDRLLLCDGCDLAYHCECLDPPLFYIPIEEWFCPPCSGILQNGAVAGPSHSRSRRVIPRTRASEAVRSRVQNLRRTQKSPAARSTSSVSRKSTTPVRRKRRRTYRKSYKKVVQLARTKKSMSDAGKGKTSARGTTVVVTYRRRRRRRRRKCGTKRLSKRSKASSNALSGPSAQQRIAKRLGISKSFDGSTMPQVKMPTSGGYRLGSRTDKMPSHSLFGNKNQLMDFSENFNEVDINAPSTSRAVSVNRRRSSEDIVPSVSAPVNILDSILAGQTLLHSKSDNVVIKNDGSLVLKTSSTNAKKVEVLKKPKVDQSTRTPMSIALVKEGAKSLILEKLLLKKSNEKKSTKERIHSGESSKSHSSKTDSSQFKRIGHKTSSNASSSNHKSRPTQEKDSKLFDEEKYIRSTLSTFKIPKKKPDRCKESERSSSSNVEDLNSISDCVQSDIPSDWESELSNPVNSVILNNRTSSVIIKKGKVSEHNKESGHPNIGSNLKSGDKLDRYNMSAQNVVHYDSSSVKVSKPTVSNYIKKEVESDQTTYSNLCENTETVRIKQEVLLDEETNADCWIQNTVDITDQKSEENCTINIKTEPVDSDFDSNASDSCNSRNENDNHGVSENENSDYDASQSIIDSVPENPIYSSQYNKWKNKAPHIKIKEEVLSDSEEYSQSLVSNIDLNLNSESLSHHTFVEKSSQLKAKNAHISELSSDLLDESLPCTQKDYFPTINHRISPDCAASNIKTTDLHQGIEQPCTEVSPLECDSSENKISKKMLKNVSSHAKNTQIFLDDDFPPTQINPASESSKESSSDESDNELPATQVNPAILIAFSSCNTSVLTGNVENNMSLNPQIEPLSSERTPLSQTNKNTILSNKSTSDKISPKHFLHCKKVVDLSETQALSETDETLPATQILNAPEEKSNLPKTQINIVNGMSSTSSGRPIIWTSITRKDSANKSDARISTLNKKSSTLASGKSHSASKKTAKVPERQVKETFFLPATQNLDESSNESCASLPPERFSSSASEPPDLPATQLLCNENVTESSLSAVQIFDKNFKEPSSLPATQIVDTSFKEPSSLPSTQIVDTSFKEPSSLPATQIVDAAFKKPSSSSETQMLDYSLIESSTLPATQNLDSTLNESQDNNKNVKSLSSSPQNQIQNQTSNKNITDILSNIKQIVNSLTQKSSDECFSKCQGDAYDAEATLDCDNSSDGSSDPKKMISTSTNEMDKENSNAFNKNVEKNINTSDSEDEELSPEKLKEMLSKSEKVNSPKNVGVHRHLPQVITVKPVKQLLKPKPPNRKTFSFEEVTKLGGPLTRKENYLSENNLSKSCMENDDLPATQIAICSEINKNDLPETQMTVNGVSKGSLEVSMASSLSNQSHNQSNNKFIKQNKTRKELIDLSGTEEINLPATQIFDSSKSSCSKLCKTMKDETVTLSDDYESSLLVTQVFSFRDENNFLKPLPKIKKENFISDSDVNNLPATQIQGLRDGSDKSNISSKRCANVSDCFTQKYQESFKKIDSNELPATQPFCNAPVQHKDTGKHTESTNYFKGTSQDYSLNSDISDLKKKSKNQVSKYFDTEKDKSNQDKRGPKRSHDNEHYEKELKRSKNIPTVSHIKLEPSDNEETFLSKRIKKNSERHAPNSSKESLSNNINKESEAVCNLEKTHVIKIKQEKIDEKEFNFEKPLEASKIMVSHSNLKNNVLKIKSEEPFDDESLPPTQIVNFDMFDDNSLPQTQILFSDQATVKCLTSNSNCKNNSELESLSHVHIKKEVLSDDEVAIIEVENCQEINVKKEIISIDDDLENTDFEKNASHSSSNSCRKNLTIKVERDVEDCKPYAKKDKAVIKSTFRNASTPESDKMATIDGKKHKNSLNFTLSEKGGKLKHDGNSSKSSSKQNVSKNGFVEVEKGKYAADNKLSKKNNKSSHSSETLNSKPRNSEYHKDVEKYKSSKDNTVPKEGKSKHDTELLKSKSKHSNCKSTFDVGKCKSFTESISTDEEKKSKYSNNLSKSKSKNRDFENNPDGFEKLKKSRDSAPMKEDRYKKHEMNLKSKSRSLKNTDKTKDSKPSSIEENTYEKHKTGSHSESRNLKSDKLSNSQKDTDHSKHSKSYQQTNSSSDKDRLARSSSEKENDNIFKTTHDVKEMLITLKPLSRKRSHEYSSETGKKRFKSGESPNSTSLSDELLSHFSALQNGSHKDSVRTSSVSSMDWNLNDNSRDFLEKESSEVHVKRDVKMISRKQELKEEIANEVKIVLKPFYSTSLISKQDYKDIMRRAVPKIFMNCHNCINPDKIRKLVLSYVSLLSNS